MMWGRSKLTINMKALSCYSYRWTTQIQTNFGKMLIKTEGNDLHISKKLYFIHNIKQKTLNAEIETFQPLMKNI